MKVGDLVKYTHAIENYFGVVVAIERPLDIGNGNIRGAVYKIQWANPSGTVKYLKYLQSDSLEKVS